MSFLLSSGRFVWGKVGAGALFVAAVCLAPGSGCGSPDQGRVGDDGGIFGRDAAVCVDVVDLDSWKKDAGRDALVDGSASDAHREVCGENMAVVGGVCMDRYEAPNRAGALPLVMFSFDEAASWCAYRGKRLCFDDEWTAACEGAGHFPYPYGNEHVPGLCNDDKTWKVYNQQLLDLWPWGLDTDSVESLDELLDLARAQSAQAAQAADHVWELYQGDPSGSHTDCVSDAPVFDLVGNVEEWTRLRSGGRAGFHGNLKGRYWAEPRTCQSNVTVHADAFRFYEIGFRCCRDLR